MIALYIIGGIALVITFLLLTPLRAIMNYEHGDFDLKVKYLFITLYQIPAKPPKPEKKKKEKRQKTPKASKSNKPEKTPDANSEPTKIQADEKKAESNEPAKKQEQRSSSETDGNSEPKKIQTDEKKAENGESVKKAAERLATLEKEEEAKSIMDQLGGGKLDFELLKKLYDTFSPPVKRLVSKLHVYEVYIDYVVGGEDAAKVAINYGINCAVLYSALAWLKNIVRLKTREVNVEADFTAQKSDLFVHCKVRVRLCTIVGCALKLLLSYMSMNNSAGAKRARKGKQNG